MSEDSCPMCRGRAVGRIGTNLFYCRDCFVEINHTRVGWKAYRIDEEGLRVPVNEAMAWGERKRNLG
ncbi:MAG: hypothetical protein AB1576_13755 [Bacillota bacterium]